MKITKEQFISEIIKDYSKDQIEKLLKDLNINNINQLIEGSISKCNNAQSLDIICDTYDKLYIEDNMDGSLKELYKKALKRYKEIYEKEEKTLTKEDIDEELKNMNYEPVEQYDNFSFDDEFDYVGKEYNEKTAVTIITPLQTVSLNGFFLNTLHNDLFNEIETKIYGDIKPKHNYLEQDIKIRYGNFQNEEIKQEIPYNIQVIIPVPINSMQYKQLTYLNEKIKDYEKKKNKKIKVSSYIKDFIYESTNYEPDEGKDNLDEALKKTVVDDNYKFPLKEINLIGHPNYENQFIDKENKKKNQKD